MKKDYSALSEEELAEMIRTAEDVLQNKKEDRKREIIQQIKELASSIDVSVDIIDNLKKSSTRKGVRVPPKYKNPDNASQKWSGRGMTPKWLQALLDQGHNLEEYKL